jgi:RimJ/RimL family protein N-acetyltransferase
MILATERLLLREVTAHDYHAVLAYQSDPRYLRYAPWTYRLRQHAWMQNRWWDMVVYAMDRAEWQAQTGTGG